LITSSIGSVVLIWVIMFVSSRSIHNSFLKAISAICLMNHRYEEGAILFASSSINHTLVAFSRILNTFTYSCLAGQNIKLKNFLYCCDDFIFLETVEEISSNINIILSQQSILYLKCFFLRSQSSGLSNMIYPSSGLTYTLTHC